MDNNKEVIDYFLGKSKLERKQEKCYFCNGSIEPDELVRVLVIEDIREPQKVPSHISCAGYRGLNV